MFFGTYQRNYTEDLKHNETLHSPSDVFESPKRKVWRHDYWRKFNFDRHWDFMKMLLSHIFVDLDLNIFHSKLIKGLKQITLVTRRIFRKDWERMKCSFINWSINFRTIAFANKFFRRPNCSFLRPICRSTTVTTSGEHRNLYFSRRERGIAEKNYGFSAEFRMNRGCQFLFLLPWRYKPRKACKFYFLPSHSINIKSVITCRYFSNRKTGHLCVYFFYHNFYSALFTTAIPKAMNYYSNTVNSKLKKKKKNKKF